MNPRVAVIWGSMITAFVVALLIVGGIVLFGGSGGDNGPSPTPFTIKGRAIVQAPGAAPEVVTAVQTVLKARLDDAGVTSTLTAASENQITIDFNGTRSVNFITDLLTGPGVIFQEPVLEDTAIKCKDTSGNEFSIPPNLLQLSGNLPLCVSADSHRGEIEWKPALGALNGVDTPLLGRMIKPTAVAIAKNDNGDDALNADFDEDGKLLLQEVTKDLVGYPLGVFLGDSLAMAPKIQREIKNGRITLAGASLEGLEELKAVLVGGELPAPVNLVSIEQQ